MDTSTEYIRQCERAAEIQPFLQPFHVVMEQEGENSSRNGKARRIRMSNKTYEDGIEAGRREVVKFANKFLEFAEYGDYSNGVEVFGVDEGRVKARELLDEWREEWEAKLKEWGIEEAKK